MSNEQSAMSVEDFPPLPEPSPLSYRSSKNRMIKLGMFSADQMHGYLLADRAARGQAATAWDNDTTQRLRSIVALLGLDYCVPDGDLTGHEFAVLGFVRRAIEKLKAAQQDTARLDFVCAEKCLIFHYPCLDGTTRYALEWPYDDTEQPGMHETPRAAIDAASTAPDTYRKRMYR